MPDEKQDDEGPLRRQAVVVVHGQGQQRPMGTIRDFVKVLWQFHPFLGGKLDPVRGRKTFIVPDDKSGIFEMQRITTEPLDCRKTDFYELYYADLLNDTPLRNLADWYERVVSARPADVPRRLHVPWRLAGLLGIGWMLLLAFVVLSIPELLRADLLGYFCRPLAPYAAALLVGAIALRGVPAFVSVSTGVLDLFRFASLALVILAVFVLFEWKVQFVAVVVAGGLALLVTTFLLPLFGDAASYLSAQTETVRSRQALRERGLRLLKALHDDPGYERVVIVAHSLGTALAYDLLQILWRDVGPTRDNPPGSVARSLLKVVEAYVGLGRQLTQQEAEAFRAAQWQAYQALARQKGRAANGSRAGRQCGWKISDFVTLGSPLTNAEFLVADGHEDFERLKEERLLPTCPPAAYGGSERLLHEEQGVVGTHHAAVFSVVRWTNIYDPFHPWLFVLGDPIGGPLCRLFGSGINDVPVKVRRRWLPRLFTHNHYWVEPSRNPGGVSPHIKALLDAVNMKGW